MKKMLASTILSLVTATGVASTLSELTGSSIEAIGSTTNPQNLSTTVPESWLQASRVFVTGLQPGELQYLRIDYRDYVNNRLAVYGSISGCVSNYQEVVDLMVYNYPGYMTTNRFDLVFSVCSQSEATDPTPGMPVPGNPTCVPLHTTTVNASTDGYGNVNVDAPYVLVDLTSVSGHPSPCQAPTPMMTKEQTDTTNMDPSVPKL